MKYCQLGIFPESEIEVTSHVSPDRFYFPVIIDGCLSIHWTLALSEFEAVLMHSRRDPYRKIWVDKNNWGIKTQDGYFCCLIQD